MMVMIRVLNKITFTTHRARHVPPFHQQKMVLSTRGLLCSALLFLYSASFVKLSPSPSLSTVGFSPFSFWEKSLYSDISIQYNVSMDCVRTDIFFCFVISLIFVWYACLRSPATLANTFKRKTDCLSLIVARGEVFVAWKLFRRAISLPERPVSITHTRRSVLHRVNPLWTSQTSL